jgi:hypothetical protein
MSQSIRQFPQQLAKSSKRSGNRFSLSWGGPLQRAQEGTPAKLGNAPPYKVANGCGRVDATEASIPGIGPALDQAALFETIDNTAYGGVRQTHEAAEIAEIDAIASHYCAHNKGLWRGKFAFGNFGIEWTAQCPADYAKVLLYLLNLYAKFPNILRVFVVSHEPFQASHRKPGMSALTCWR